MVRARPICQLTDIPDGGDTAITAKIDGKKIGLIALRKGIEVSLFINSCPHIGTPLDLTPGQFLNVDKTFIQCSTHGALFEKDSGLCVFGPCVDLHLDGVPCRVEDGQVWRA
ncbi:MAG: Rieske 2Fe-2S domain-containing protein [Rhodospirillaceae bacterium]|nr:Rieske 2Fe-2S domain-containing protein [Rhodospirillaceae bacterium]